MNVGIGTAIHPILHKQQQYVPYSNNQQHHQSVPLNNTQQVQQPHPNSMSMQNINHENPNNLQPSHNNQHTLNNIHHQQQLQNTINSNDFNIGMQQQQQMQQQQHNNQMQYQHNPQQHQQQTQLAYSTNGQPQQQQMQGHHQQQQHSTLELHPNIVLGGLLDIDIDERPHQCQICQATYKTRTHLRRHMFVHLQNRPYPCPDCSKGFNRKEHLNKHIEAVHSKNRYKCEMCGKEISRKDHLARHIKNIHNADISDAALQAHLNAAIPQPSTSLIPTSPSKKLQQMKHKSQNLLSSNDGIHFMMGDSLPSNNNDILKSNEQHTQPSKVPKVNNNQQPMSILDQLKQTNDLLMNAAADENKKMLTKLHTCQECNATFSLEKDLNIHSRVHKPQPYRCNQCPRAYTRREKLTEHIRCFHQGQKFSCEYCDKQLSRKDHVLRHVRSVHPEVLANRFVAIAENGNVNNITNVTGDHRNEQPSSSNSSTNQSHSNTNSSIPSMGDMGILLRSVCHVCLKVFGTSYHLARHVESCHNGDNRPFSCNMCKKQFKRKDHLTKHTKSHCPSAKDQSHQNSRNSCNNNSKKTISKNTSGTNRQVSSELSTINQQTIDSLQIEMATPDEDVEVALSIVSNSIDSSTNSAGITATATSTTSKTMKGGTTPMSDSSTAVITKLTAMADTAKLLFNNSSISSSNSLNKMMEHIINTTSSISSNNGNRDRFIAKKSTYKSSSSSATAAAAATNIDRVNDFTCGHCQYKSTSKEKMIQHVQQHSSIPSSSSSSHSTQSTSSTSNSNNNLNSSNVLGDIVELTNNWT